MRLCALFVSAVVLCLAAERPPVFPIPRQITTTAATFAVTESVVIALPSAPTAADRKFARLMMAELSDQYGLGVRPTSVATLSAKKPAIVIGTVANPLVRQMAAARKLDVSGTKPGSEGYVLDVRPEGVLVAGSDEAGAFYGLQTLKQLMRREGRDVSIQGASVRDWPYKPFRGVKLYMPGRENLAYFRRFITEFMAPNKYNKMVLELNAAMRFDKHPELNAGWLDMARDLNATHRDRPAGPHGNMNSVHHDTADGGILEKDEIAAIVQLAKDNYIEVIPEIPSLAHSYYLLTRHPELAEVPDQWPDTYCPSLPGSYELFFDVLDEYIDVMKPRMIHVGKDEWRMPWGVCPRCRKRNHRDVFVEDLLKTYNHLNKRGIKVAMWGDYLIQPLRGDDLREKTSPTGWKYKAPGAISPDQVKKLVPKDILMFNWFWDEKYASTGQGEKDDLLLEEWGFQQIYGNMSPYIQNYERRSARKSVIGGAPSSWAATTEFNFGKDLMRSLLGCANLLWSTVWPNDAELSDVVQDRVSAYRRRLQSDIAPSEIDPVTPWKLTGGGSAPVEIRKGRVTAGRLSFDIDTPVTVAVRGAKPVEGPVESAPIAIGEDVSSVIFLHATARPATNNQAYRFIANFADTADLLGWYEIVYEDGYVQTVPLRYRVNILEYNRPQRQDSTGYCYGADAVDLGDGVQFYAFEWKNARYGKVIREVRLKGTSGFKQDKPIANNSIMLAAVSVVKKRPAPGPIVPAITHDRPE